MSSRALPRVLLLFSCLVLATSPALAENGSLLFDGAEDYVTVPEPVDVRGPLTLEAWVKVDADPGGGRIVSNRVSGRGYEMDVVKFDDYYELRLSLDGNAAAYTEFTGHQGLWTHVAVTWAGSEDGTARLYINGMEAGSDLYKAETNPSSGPLRIGAMGSGSWFYRGQIDEVRIWSTVLDGATLAAWMSRPLTAEHPDYGSLEAYWNFDEGSGQVLHNLAGDARRDGELGASSGEDTNDPQWQADGAPVPVVPATIGQIKQHFLKP